jgi:hypothetical protein
LQNLWNFAELPDCGIAELRFLNEFGTFAAQASMGYHPWFPAERCSVGYGKPELPTEQGTVRLNLDCF